MPDAKIAVEVPEDADDLLSAIYEEASSTTTPSKAKAAAPSSATPVADSAKSPSSKSATKSGKKGSEKVEADPKKGKCRMEGCEKKLVPKRVSIAANLFTFFTAYQKGKGEWSGKHHCRHCKLKVCDDHFKTSPGGKRLCTKCLEAGIDGKGSPSSPNSVKSEEDEEDDEEDDETTAEVTKAAAAAQEGKK
jgi:hypothetical protein